MNVNMQLSLNALRSRLVFLRFLALAITLPLLSTTQAAEFPSRPVKFVVSLSPGGWADTLARQLAKGLATKWGQPVLVENKPGADATIGKPGYVYCAGQHFTPNITWWEQSPAFFTFISVKQSSGTSPMPSSLAASAGNSQVMSGVAVKRMLTNWSVCRLLACNILEIRSAVSFNR